MGKKIVKYVMGFYRSADLEGVFVMTDKELEAVKQMDGSKIHYGEVAGKHSDVSCKLEFKDIEILSDKEEEVAFFERILPHGAGFGFKGYWFDSDTAYDEGYQAGKCKSYENVEAALEEHGKWDNEVMKGVFTEGFNDGRKGKWDSC